MGGKHKRGYGSYLGNDHPNAPLCVIGDMRAKRLAQVARCEEPQRLHNHISEARNTTSFNQPQYLVRRCQNLGQNDPRMPLSNHDSQHAIHPTAVGARYFV